MAQVGCVSQLESPINKIIAIHLYADVFGRLLQLSDFTSLKRNLLNLLAGSANSVFVVRHSGDFNRGSSSNQRYC